MRASLRGTTRSVVYLGYLLAFLLLGGAVLVIHRGQDRYLESVAWAEHSYDVLDHAAQLLVTVQRAEGSARGYALSGLATYRDDAVDNLAAVDSLFAGLDAITGEDPEQQANLDSVLPLLARRKGLVDSLVRLRDREGRVSPAMATLVAEASGVSFPLRHALARVTATERRLLGARQAEVQLRGRQTVQLVIGGLAFALVIVAAAASLTFSELRERERAEARLQADAERQAVMIDLQQAIATATTNDPAVLDLIVEQVMALTRASGAAITFVDGDAHVARVARGDLAAWLGVRNTLANSLTGSVLQRREPEVVQDTHLDPRVDRAIADKLGTRSTALLPVVSGDRGVGALVVSSRQPNAFGPQDLAALRIMSGILSAGISNAAAAEANARLLAELRKSRDAAEEANRAKSAFLATMSHELRTPLNSVIGFSNLLLKNRGKNLSDQDLQFLGRIRDNGTHLLGLINDILDVSKIEAGKMEVHPEPTDVAPLVRETVAQLGGQLGTRAVELHAEAPEGLLSVEVDPARLRQVLINLIGNALKFTEQGSVTVRVVADTEGRPARIDVTDTGIGIPADRIESIFEAFAQAETTTERRYGGTGLGLTISRSMLRLMDADLTVRSVVGQGSTFSIILPHEHVEATGPVDGPGILIVDDDVHTRQLLSALMSAEGFRVTTAREGRDALVAMAAADRLPAAVLLDLKMPVMSGHDFLRAFRADERYRGVPIIVVTSLDIDSTEVRGAGEGAVAVVAKGPGMEQTLQDLLRTMVPR